MIVGTHIAFASALYLGGAALVEYDTYGIFFGYMPKNGRCLLR